MDCEVLVATDYAVRGRKMIQAMINAAPPGVRVHVSQECTRKHPVLMTYGLGHLVRHTWTNEHLAAGGRLIGWDLGYWNREDSIDFKMRLTIDADHPHRLIRPMPADRLAKDGIRLREDANPDGPIVLIGLGKKQRAYKRFDGQEWERATLHRIREQFPDRRVVYRPKKEEEAPEGLEIARGPIDQALRGASLVVCGHSNVAVDACIAGIPVICDDGAAYALYKDCPNPTREQRQSFLESLAWWQWSPREAGQAWTFILEELER